MKKLLLIIAACIFTFNIQAQVKWESIEQASQAPNTEKKAYFIDFYTSWCGWCKKMDKETFTDPTVIKILNKYYIPVKFNAEGNSEFKWNGIKYNNAATTAGGRPSTHTFARTILGQEMGFPSFGIFTSDKSLQNIIQGYQTSDELIPILWYFASGDYKKYTFDTYLRIFAKEIQPEMNHQLGL